MKGGKRDLKKINSPNEINEKRILIVRRGNSSNDYSLQNNIRSQ
jgi:hypothetical protein